MQNESLILFYKK